MHYTNLRHNIQIKASGSLYRMFMPYIVHFCAHIKDAKLDQLVPF